MGLSFGPDAVAQGLLQPYKVSTWDSIPDSAKDADGNWYGDYYGILAFETNTEAQPNPPTIVRGPAEARLQVAGRAAG